MKTSAFFLFLAFISLCSFGQDETISSDTLPKGKKNVVKFLPVNLAFNSISFEYERKFSSKNSFIVGIGIPSEKPFVNKFGNDGDPSDISNDLLRTMAIRAAYRHYTGHRTQAAGFYLSPYLKYQTYSIGARSSQTTDLGTPFTANIKADGSTISAGLQLGAQVMIAKRVCIDFYFLGIEAGLVNFNGEVTTSSSDPTVMNEMKQSVDDFISDLPPFIGDKFSTSQSGSTIEVKGTSVPYPWFRGGISIGIAF
jgi:hypothetical protein